MASKYFGCLSRRKHRARILTKKDSKTHLMGRRASDSREEKMAKVGEASSDGDHACETSYRNSLSLV